MSLYESERGSVLPFENGLQPEQLDTSERVDIDLRLGHTKLSFKVPKHCKDGITDGFTHFQREVKNNIDEADVVTLSNEPSLIMLRFVEYCRNFEYPNSIVRALIDAFEDQYLIDTDIHTLTEAYGSTIQKKVLRNYFTALHSLGISGRVSSSALFSDNNANTYSIYAICGGQGLSSRTCLRELHDIYKIYESHLTDLLGIASRTLRDLAAQPSAASFFADTGFDVDKWIKLPGTSPDEDEILLAPYSFPLIGLLSLAHFCVTCKILNKNPGELAARFKGITGHSQGVIAAAAIARSRDWLSFYEAAQIAITMLFWTGFETYMTASFEPLPSEIVRNCQNSGMGTPSPMLSIRGLKLDSVEEILQGRNCHLPENEQIYMSLANSRDNFVIAGPPRSLYALTLYLQNLVATSDQDQSRIVFNKRKPLVQYQFLPMSSAFHCPYSSKAVAKIIGHLDLLSISFNGEDLVTGLFHSNTGVDMRSLGENSIVCSLVEMICSDTVNWPICTNFEKESLILDFGPGKLGSIVHKQMEGLGSRVIFASEFTSSSEDIGNKSELFSKSALKMSTNWENAFKPRLVTDSNGAVKIENKMTQVFGTPPIMVGGMTPTTVHWDFVSSIMNAGYHAEIACGGYNTSESLEEAIFNLSTNMPATGGITCNIIYASPKTVKWQIPLIRRLIRRGFPIEGLTVGAGVPSAEVVSEYIDTLGLKHISFKPGSVDSIKNVIDIAKAHPQFPIGLQWTGGRGGGHHSYEDFHEPILDTYGRIRRCSNIILIAGSGFGGFEDTFPYLTGTWSTTRGYPAMPFDGILLGSRMMIAKEAHTSHKAKKLIAEAKGVDDEKWQGSYENPTGGVITVKSEMGQPIHKLATRGVIFWSELDKKIFSITDRKKRLAVLRDHRDWIIERLNKDFQKPWFAVKADGRAVDVEDMTYLEILRRLASLMYLQEQNRWIDVSYRSFFTEFAKRASERLPQNGAVPDWSVRDCPNKFLACFHNAHPTAREAIIHPEDVSYFIGLCSERGRKPVNFIPRLDDSFETWFKKDSLWQAEDVEAVIDQDAQRTCIIHGPVAARYSSKIDEPAQNILDSIQNGYITALTIERSKSSQFTAEIDTQTIPVESGGYEDLAVERNSTTRVFEFPTDEPLPGIDMFRENITSNLPKSAHACIHETYVKQGRFTSPNPIRAAIVPLHSHRLVVNFNNRRNDWSMIMSARSENPSLWNQILRVSGDGDDQVSIVFTCHKLISSASPSLTLQFSCQTWGNHTKLIEDMKGRNERIKKLYTELWLGRASEDLEAKGLNQRFLGKSCIITKSLVQEFVQALAPRTAPQYSEESMQLFAPIDISIVVAWEALVKPLLSTAIDCDLLKLLHRSNEFRYINDAKPLRVGDHLESSSYVRSITRQNEDKLVEVVAEISRSDQPIIEVVSQFILKGPFENYEGTMRRIEESQFEMFVASTKESALLASRPWAEFLCPAENLIGKTLRFNISTQTTSGNNNSYSSLYVTGTITSKAANATEELGKVYYEHGNCYGNPVSDFLDRHGFFVHTNKSVNCPGLDKDSTWPVTIPKTCIPYARVSKDINPIHLSSAIARYAQLPQNITHGMCTSAVVRKSVERVVAEANRSCFRRWYVSFEGMVFPGEILDVKVEHTAMIDGRMLLKVIATSQTKKEKVLEAEAEVEQAKTAYLFTGQGSQEQGMGLRLYETSKAARTVWDTVDKHLMELYGFSILDIVRNDPKSITVHFRGVQGRKMRQNYLDMTIDKVQASGEIVQEPIIKGLTMTTQSYTFFDSRGLLYSTQFAQPALTLMELATFKDLESRGMIQEGASYAGHSLGEYSALGAMARAIPIESLVELVFYRGLTMQLAMERDTAGRTEFSMVAVNPSYVSKSFTQASLEAVVQTIAKDTGLLLEVVNFNVKERQYVCAGHLRALWALTQILNSANYFKDTKLARSYETLEMMRGFCHASNDLAEPVELERGRATIPLQGIDVPFHSTYLRSGIPAYRRFLETKFLDQNIDLDRLGGFIPNVMAKPFSTERSYVEEAVRITDSEDLRDLLQNWIEN